MPSYEEYIAFQTEGFEIGLAVNRSLEIEAHQAMRNLAFVGRSIFRQAVQGYLLGRKDDADEMLAKATRCLKLAHSIPEVAHDYEPGYDEGTRAAALSYVHWLSTGEQREDLRVSAREAFGEYYGRTWRPDRTSAQFATPMLLYLEAYAVLRQIEERFAQRQKSGSARKASGLFAAALEAAEVETDAGRREKLEVLQKKVSSLLFRWVDWGYYDDVAYALYALFPKPDGPPYILIEDVWRYMPGKPLKKWKKPGTQ
jgi:hypothetical protein